MKKTFFVSYWTLRDGALVPGIHKFIEVEDGVPQSTPENEIFLYLQVHEPERHAAGPFVYLNVIKFVPFEELDVFAQDDVRKKSGWGIITLVTPAGGNVDFPLLEIKAHGAELHSPEGKITVIPG